MVSRREFTRTPNIVAYLAFIVSLLALFALAAIAAFIHIPITNDSSVAELSLARVFGFMGMPTFGGAAFFLAKLTLRVMKRGEKPLLILDSEALLFGNLKVPWKLMRETVMHKATFHRYVGIRTANDRDLVRKMDEALAGKVPYMFLFGLHYRQWRAQCPIVIPAMNGISVENLRNLIEEYRVTYGSMGASSSGAP